MFQIRNLLFWVAAFILGLNNLVAQTKHLATVDPNLYQTVSNFGIEMNGYYYFVTANTTYGDELWRTDGTSSGTTLVKDIIPGSTGAFYNISYQGVVYKNKLYFLAKHPDYGIEIWRTDGTAAGTELFIDLTSGPTNSNIGSFCVVNNRLLFQRYSGGVAYLYSTNGSPTNIVSNGSFEIIYGIYSMGSYAVMSARKSPYGTDLWRTNGTNSGTYLLRDVNPGASNSFPSHFVRHNDLVFFDAITDTHGYELWKSDGTFAGTQMVKDIYPGVNNGLEGFYGPPIGVSHYGHFYFGANDGTGTELWKTDGLAANTVKLSNLTTTSLGINLSSGIYAHGEDVVFLSQNGPAMYKYDTLANLVLPTEYKASYTTNFIFKNGIQYYMLQDSLYGKELFANDGLPGGEVRMQELVLNDNYSPTNPTSTPFTFMGTFGNTMLIRALEWDGTKYYAKDLNIAIDACVPPSKIAISRQNGTTSAVIWNRINDAERYQIRYRISGAPDWTTSGSRRAYFVLRDLINAATYEYQLRVYCSTGYSDWSPIYTYQNSATTVGTQPFSILAERYNTATSVRIFMHKNPDGVKTGLRYKPFGAASWVNTSVSTSPIRTLDGLGPNTFYEYEMRSYRANIGYGLWQKYYFFTESDLVYLDEPIAAERAIPTSSSEFMLFPNPAPSREAVSILVNTDILRANLVVLDANGRLVREQTLANLVAGDRVSVDCSDLTTGHYFVYVLNPSTGGILMVKKLEIL